MMQEAVPVLTFGNYKMGKPILVDIHDPTVAGLIKAGYLKIRPKEPPHGANSVDSAGPGKLLVSGVGAGAEGNLPEAQETVDGPGEDQPSEEDSPRAQGDSTLHSPDG